jgi:DNA-binding NarL/FixJ family response regulator
MRDRILNEIIGSPERIAVPYDALMPRKISNLLLVSSLYDYYTFIEDGSLSEMLFSEFLDLDLRFTPSIQRVSTAEEALERLRTESFDLVISMARVGEMNVREFGEAVKSISPDLPVVLLACNARELAVLPPIERFKGIDALFMWQGDVRLFLVIIKHIEDRRNAWHDAQAAGVRSIILVEDSVQFYSSYLPMLYTEILKQIRALTAESVTRAQKIMRMRARPKVLLARTYEEAAQLYEQYQNSLLGVIVDAAFPRNGVMDATAGFQFAQMLRARAPDLPMLIQSDPRNAPLAASLGLPFVDKSSPHLLRHLRDFMQEHLGFGDFVFVRPDGTVISRAPDLRTLEWAVQAVPDEDLFRNVSRNDLCTWLIARAEFDLAEAVRTIASRTGQTTATLRRDLLEALRSFRQRSVAGVVAEYSSRTFEGGGGVVRIGKGSLGGKGRGLAFVNSLINTYQLERRFPAVRIFVPPTAVLTTEVFDRFMESSGLLSYALEETDDRKITRAFLEADMPADAMENLWEFLQWVRYPLAVRSSSLLEDASYQPFAGIYKTYMIPNNHEQAEVRLDELSNAIKRVYASTYHADPKAYMKSLPSRLEEEKMAVVIQQVVGARHGSRLYPDLAGVGRSLNFYPMPGMKSEDGLVSVALGMGKTVVEGGRCVRFCPAYPRKPMQSFTPDDYVDNSQKSFFALDLSRSQLGSGEMGETAVDLVSFDLDAAERDGTLAPVASVYSPDEDAVHDGLSRKGIRLVTMAGVLKGKVFPLADVTAFLLRVGAAASSCPVEIEFVVNLADSPRACHEFAFLQIRPLVLGSEGQEVRIEDARPDTAVCISHRALGNGLIEGVSDLIYVRPQTFDRLKTPQIAEEIGRLNATLQHQARRYLLVGPGRWGSADPWLGIPVKWAHICAVCCIVETDLADIHVDPSQGSHFFQNITSFGIGYLTVDRRMEGDFLDIPWLDRQPSATETPHLRHVRFSKPLRIALNGKVNVGVVMKPEE